MKCACVKVPQLRNMYKKTGFKDTIGVVTHNTAKAKDAATNLTQKFVPQFAQLVTDASRLPLDPVTQTRDSEKGPWSVSATIQSPVQIPVLADGLFVHADVAVRDHVETAVGHRYRCPLSFPRP